MQRDRQHPRVVVERGLHPVAVVHVDVDVGDALEAVVEQPGDRDRAVVVDAEPRRPVAHGVVQAARDVHRAVRPALRDLPRRRERAAADQAAGLVHVREDRVVVGAQAVHRVAALSGARAHGRHVGRRVDPLHLGGRAGSGSRSSTPSRNAELAGQPHGQVEPDRVERVVRAQAVGEELRRPHHRGSRAHGAEPRSRRDPRQGRPGGGSAGRSRLRPVATGRRGSADQCDQDPA